jgi:uncharacterized protein YndB with AHSA1/START domain
VQTIHIDRVLRATPEQIFDVLADHARYTRFPGIKAAQLLREGRDDRNGVGALRKVVVAGAWFEEEITQFERPTRLGYHIVRSFPPVEHERGEIVLAPHPDGVRVTWTSVFRIKVPWIGGLLGAVAVKQMRAGFDLALETAERLVR